MTRRLTHPASSDPVYTDDELAFLKAVDTYKRENRRPHPSWREVLRIAEAVGYRRVAAPGPLPTFRGD